MPERDRTSIIFLGPQDPGAGAPHQHMAAIWLARRGHDVTFIGPGPEDESAFRTPLGSVAADFLGAPDRIPSLRWQLRLFRRIFKHRWRSNGSTIFYVQGSPMCFAASVALALVPRNRVIYHTQDFLEPGRHPFWEFFERHMARRSGSVITNEPNRARFFASHYRLSQPPIVVRTALPRDWPIPPRRQEARNELLGIVGRKDDAHQRIIMAGGSFSPLRCSEQLIRAVAVLPRSYVMVFTGMKDASPAVQRGREMLSAIGVEDRTILLDRLPYDQLLRYFAASDVGALLYPNDGIGHYFQAPGRLTEFMACGVPIVTSHFPGLELLCLKYGIGVACDPSSPKEIAAAIRTLGERPADQREAERQRLRTLAKGEFAYECHASRIESELDSLRGGTK